MKSPIIIIKSAIALVTPFVGAWIEISDANSDAKLIKESLQELTGVAIEIC